MTEIEVGWGIENYQEISEEMAEIEIGQGQAQEQVQIETGLDASDAENVIILPGTV